MIYVDYVYRRKKDGKVCKATAEFDTPNKAIRFIYGLANKKMYMESLSADDNDELYDVINKL